MGLSEAATEKLLIIADKISNQKYMSAIKNAFSTLMPVIITGAFCTLVTNVICSTTTDGISLAKVSGFAWLEVLSPIFNAANYATLNFFTIGAVVLIGLELGKKMVLIHLLQLLSHCVHMLLVVLQQLTLH